VNEVDLSNVLQRLSALEAEKNILRTLYQYGHCIDYGDRTGWLDCFTADAVFELKYQQANGPVPRTHGEGETTDKGIRYSGRDALKSFVETHTSAPQMWHKHLLIEPCISLANDGRSASVTSYFLRVDDRSGERIIMAFGRYIDSLVLEADGRWRFKHRTAEIESVL